MAEQRAPAATIERERPAGDGVYVYSIVESGGPQTFGKIGIGGRGDDVYTVHYRDLAAVIGRTPLVVYDPTRENALAHEHVNEVLIEAGSTPVPMSFGTMFKTEKDAIEFLKDTYDALRDVLEKLKGKLEYSLKVNWAREHRFADSIEGFNVDWKARGYERRATGPWPTYRASGPR